MNNIFHAYFKLSVLLTQGKGFQKITGNSEEDAGVVIRKTEKKSSRSTVGRFTSKLPQICLNVIVFLDYITNFRHKSFTSISYRLNSVFPRQIKNFLFAFQRNAETPLFYVGRNDNRQ